MRVHIVLHDREFSHGASLQDVTQDLILKKKKDVTQECQGIPPGDGATFSIWSPQSPQKREEGERKKEKSLVLFLKPTSHLCVFHLNSIYSEKSSLLSYPRYWSYPLSPHFPYLLHLENDPQKQQAMYEERTQQNMVTWRARAESALRKTTISYVKRCWKDWVKHPSHALSSVARAKRPFHRFFVWLRF